MIMMQKSPSLRRAALAHAANGFALVGAMTATLALAAWLIAGGQGVVLSLTVVGATLVVATGLPPCRCG